MIVIDSEMLYDGEAFRGIAAQGETEEEFLYFVQDLEAKLECQETHDEALYHLDIREDEKVYEKKLDSEASI